MAASSSSHPSTSLIDPRNKYDVFLSFRGEDTRNNFISHLYEVLCRNNIETFIDDQLIRGVEISKFLLNAIEASSISLIIFSEGYASSKWCLDELLKIFDCNKKYQQIVIPIFYGVDPSHVRKQNGTFGELFSKLQGGPDKMRTWRNTLTEAANISGFHSRNFRTDSELVKEVVNHIVKKLAEVFPRDNKDQLVGVKSKVMEIESLLTLDTELKDVLTLGIWGIGGIGKTTIARAVFDKISSNFEGSCFLENVREESERPGGLSCLQQKLVSKLLKDEKVKTEMFDIDFNFKRLSRKKVLIVLDDVTCLNQFESLIGSLDWFMSQSQIIITTRDKQVLRNCEVKETFEVKTLEDHHAFELFSRHAFKQNHPDVGYKELAYKVIIYAQGLPLALKVLGCFLSGKKTEEWESAINKLEKSIDPKIQKVLKISYDDLDYYEKNIFLDLACLFKGEKVDLVMKFLDANGFYPKIGIRVLEDKSLINISNNMITMHDLLQEMGMEIVRQESINDPGKRSRLWHHEDIFNVLTTNSGTEAIECICLNMSKVKEISLNPGTFTKMHKLRFLKFYSSSNRGNKCKIPYFQGPGLAEVKYFYWHGYPLKSLPSNIYPEKLVSLEMPNSNIEQLWDSVQHHGIFRQIISAICQKLFTKSPNPSSTEHPNKLVTLNLSGCKSLKSIPELTHLECLKDLYLANCSKLKMIPEFSNGNIENICLRGTAIEELPSSIGCLARLLELDLEECRSLKSLPNSLCKLKSLKYLKLSWCSNLQRLPDEIENLESLVRLSALDTAIREVPSSIGRLKYLNFLEFEKIEGLSLSISLYLDSLHNLLYLNLTDCGITELPQSLFLLSFLRVLCLGKNNFEIIPEGIIQLHRLLELHLSYCERLRSLPKLPWRVNRLNVHDCSALESVSSLFPRECLPPIYVNNLRNNFKLDQRIPEDALQQIQLIETEYRKRLHEPIYYPEIHGHVILPGNEIPKWFRFQSMGSDVSLNLPPGFFNDNKVIGFAFSFIVEVWETEPPVRAFGFYLVCEFNLESKECDSPVIMKHIPIGDGINGVESDHLILGYYFFYGEELSKFLKYNCAVKFYFMEYWTSKVLECCRVKKCGVHLFPVSAEEAEELPSVKEERKEMHLDKEYISFLGVVF